MKIKVARKTRPPSEQLLKARKVVEDINKALGVSGAVYMGSEAAPFERIPTGIAALDYVMGGGLVKGQMVQFTGGDSCAKTTAAMIAVANSQKLYPDGVSAWIAGEGFDKKWARYWGVDLDRLFVITSAMGDTALEAAMTLVESNTLTTLTIDSLQSLGTTRELEKSGVEDEAYAGAGAGQMWGRVMRRTYSAMNSGANAAVIGISQVRAAIGKWSPHGTPDDEGTGIRAIKHWKAVDVVFKKAELHFEGKDERKKMIGRQFKIKCIKNKTARSERASSFDMMYGSNGKPYIDNLPTLVRLAKVFGLVEQKGSWHVFGDIREQSEEKFIAKLRSKNMMDFDEAVMAEACK